MHTCISINLFVCVVYRCICLGIQLPVSMHLCSFTMHNQSSMHHCLLNSTQGHKVCSLQALKVMPPHELALVYMCIWVSVYFATSAFHYLTQLMYFGNLRDILFCVGMPSYVRTWSWVHFYYKYNCQLTCLTLHKSCSTQPLHAQSQCYCF